MSCLFTTQQSKLTSKYLLQIIFRAENGGGQLVVEYTANNLLELCDGQWHAIKATKDKNVVKLQVDGGSILEGGGKGSQRDANIYDPLYVGGLPGQHSKDLLLSVSVLFLSNILAFKLCRAAYQNQR